MAKRKTHFECQTMKASDMINLLGKKRKAICYVESVEPHVKESEVHAEAERSPHMHSSTSTSDLMTGTFVADCDSQDAEACLLAELSFQCGHEQEEAMKLRETQAPFMQKTSDNMMACTIPSDGLKTAEDSLLDTLVNPLDIQAMQAQADKSKAASCLQGPSMPQEGTATTQSRAEAVFKKRGRIVLTPLQTRILGQVLEKTWFPPSETRLRLAQLLNVPERTVQVWFQNQRQKAKQNYPKTLPLAVATASYSPASYGGDVLPLAVSTRAAHQGLQKSLSCSQHPVLLTNEPLFSSELHAFEGHTFSSSSNVSQAIGRGPFEGRHNSPPASSAFPLAALTALPSSTVMSFSPSNSYGVTTKHLADEGLYRLYEATLLLTAIDAAAGHGDINSTLGLGLDGLCASAALQDFRSQDLQKDCKTRAVSLKTPALLHHRLPSSIIFSSPSQGHDLSP